MVLKLSDLVFHILLETMTNVNIYVGAHILRFSLIVFIFANLAVFGKL